MGQMSFEDHAAEAMPPWRRDHEDFSPSATGTDVLAVIEEVRAQRRFLTLVDQEGRLYPKILLIKLTGESLLIDKPLEWPNDLADFRVFFRNQRDHWSFFTVAGATVLPFNLSFGLPLEVYSLQRRRYPRINMPQGTTVIFKKDGKYLSPCYVRDISPAGMLVCSGSPSSALQMNSVFSDILISLPDDSRLRQKVLPPIDNGQVVRSFFERENNLYCHGIAFDYKSAYVREALSTISAQLS